ncbi:hypothetical protein F5148DRAFT_1234797, partial [Russula earlei]
PRRHRSLHGGCSLAREGGLSSGRARYRYPSRERARDRAGVREGIAHRGQDALGRNSDGMTLPTMCAICAESASPAMFGGAEGRVREQVLPGRRGRRLDEAPPVRTGPVRVAYPRTRPRWWIHRRPRRIQVCRVLSLRSNLVIALDATIAWMRRADTAPLGAMAKNQDRALVASKGAPISQRKGSSSGFKEKTSQSAGTRTKARR